MTKLVTFIVTKVVDVCDKRLRQKWLQQAYAGSFRISARIVVEKGNFENSEFLCKLIDLGTICISNTLTTFEKKISFQCGLIMIMV